MHDQRRAVLRTRHTDVQQAAVGERDKRHGGQYPRA
jgi:hypothetical protein